MSNKNYEFWELNEIKMRKLICLITDYRFIRKHLQTMVVCKTRRLFNDEEEMAFHFILTARYLHDD